jgi:RNase adapter protein RapZ
MQWLILAGTSGAGKSVALAALEDVGFHCVNNLPASLLPEFGRFLRSAGHQKVAASIDTKTAGELYLLPSVLKRLREEDRDVQFIFLDAKIETLVKRFSETRRRHPLDDGHRTLKECIVYEKNLLGEILDIDYRLDTSDLRPTALRAWMKDLIKVDTQEIVLQFQSFGFKHGVPHDADFVFDVRCLPNPFYEPALASLTGLDMPVKEFLKNIPDVQAMINEIKGFVERWLPCFIKDQRSYLTVAIGCTGGQHRSVCIAEALAEYFSHQNNETLVRHRELTIKNH